MAIAFTFWGINLLGDHPARLSVSHWLGLLRKLQELP